MACTGAPQMGAPQMSKRIITVKAAADTTGLSERSVWRLIATGKLRTTKIGTRTLIFADSLDELLEAGATDRPPINEPPNKNRPAQRTAGPAGVRCRSGDRRSSTPKGNQANARWVLPGSSPCSTTEQLRFGK